MSKRIKLEFPNLPKFESNNINYNICDEITLFEKEYPYEIYKYKFKKEIISNNLPWNQVVIIVNKIVDKYISYTYDKYTFTWKCNKSQKIFMIGSSTQYYNQFIIKLI
jgi:hypothetical protein